MRGLTGLLEELLSDAVGGGVLACLDGHGQSRVLLRGDTNDVSDDCTHAVVLFIL